MFFNHIPSTYRFRVLGLTTSDKLFVYLLATQMMFANSPQSFYSALIGIASGIISRSEALALHRRSMPSAVKTSPSHPLTTLKISNFCRRYLLPLIQTPRPSIVTSTTALTSNRSPPQPSQSGMIGSARLSLLRDRSLRSEPASVPTSPSPQ
jgi:hypothetical protein